MDQKYFDLMLDVRENGDDGDDRTGTGTRSVLGRMYRHDLRTGFPLLTTKKLHIRSIVHELLWFLRGDTNIKYLQENGVTIWDEWATPDGELGPVYGAMWRKWPGPNGEPIDQVKNLIEGIKKHPHSRRHIINGWNVGYLPDESKSPQENAAAGKMAIPPCHVMYQFHVSKGRLSCMLTQRSGDLFLGIPYNCASLAFLTHMVAQQCDLEPHEIVHSIGNLHIYNNHNDQVDLQLSRDIRSMPKLVLNRKPESIFDYKFEDFEIIGYDPHPGIKAPIAV